jgi:hypothetical protein
MALWGLRGSQFTASAISRQPSARGRKAEGEEAGSAKARNALRNTYGSPVMDVGERVFVRGVGGVRLVRMRA